MDFSDDQIRGLPHDDLVRLFIQMRDEYTEFQSSSSEMEKLMDADLDDLKAQLKRAETRNQQLTTEQIRNKDRHDESRIQWVTMEEQLRRENSQLVTQCNQQKERILKLEQRNDVLERSERNKEYLASDLGTKLDQAIEKIAMLESELYEKQVVTEEMNRLREEQMRTTTERPQLRVEPLRNDPEILPDEPSPGPSKAAFRMSIDDVHMEDVQDVRMEEAITEIDEVCIDDNKNIQGKKMSTGAGACINRIVKDLMTKVERLDSMLSTIRVSNSSNNNPNHLTTTRA